MNRTLTALAFAGVVATLASGCSSQGSDQPSAAASATVSPRRAVGQLIPYDRALVPTNGWASVQWSEPGGKQTSVTLLVHGLAPNHQYGAHAHVNPCGAAGTAAGPHFQRKQDPVSPSTKPQYANPRNEIWLDLTTDGSGNGTSTTTVPWTMPLDRRASSVVLHAERTHTGASDSGMAGARVGCLTVPF